MKSSIHRVSLGKEGFSLVEVALALLVVAIGFSAVFGLFPAGMQASRTAIEETEMSEFSDFVFASLEALAISNWDDLDLDDFGWPIRNSEVISTRVIGLNPTPVHRIRAAPPDEPVIFTWTPAVMGFDVTHFTYSLTLDTIEGTGGNMRQARLQVWPGLRDQAVRDGGGINFPGGIVFYREYRRPD